MANNKVELADGRVLLDLTKDTVTPATLLKGETAHGADGAQIVGTYEPQSGGTEPVLQALSVTKNGTYTPGSGVDGFNRVSVNVSQSGGFGIKRTIIETTIDEFGCVTFGNYTDLVDAADTFSHCIAFVEDSSGVNIMAAMTLVCGGVNGNVLTMTGNYLNSSQAIHTLEGNSDQLAFYDENKVWWWIDPNCILTGRNVKLDVYEVAPL